MKSLSLLLFLAFALAVQAQVIQFAISPSRGPPTPGFAISNNGNMTYVRLSFAIASHFLNLFRLAS